MGNQGDDFPDGKLWKGTLTVHEGTPDPPFIPIFGDKLPLQG